MCTSHAHGVPRHLVCVDKWDVAPAAGDDRRGPEPEKQRYRTAGLGVDYRPTRTGNGDGASKSPSSVMLTRACG